MDEQIKHECIAKDVRISCSGKTDPDTCLCDAHFVLFDWWLGRFGYLYMFEDAEDENTALIAWLKVLSDEGIEKIRIEAGKEMESESSEERPKGVQ